MNSLHRLFTAKGAGSKSRSSYLQMVGCPFDFGVRTRKATSGLFIGDLGDSDRVCFFTARTERLSALI